MNKEIDKLICDVDGKLAYYRMTHIDDEKLRKIQKIINKIYNININEKGLKNEKQR